MAAQNGAVAELVASARAAIAGEGAEADAEWQVDLVPFSASIPGLYLKLCSVALPPGAPLLHCTVPQAHHMQASCDCLHSVCREAARMWSRSARPRQRLRRRPLRRRCCTSTAEQRCAAAPPVWTDGGNLPAGCVAASSRQPVPGRMQVAAADERGGLLAWEPATDPAVQEEVHQQCTHLAASTRAVDQCTSRGAGSSPAHLTWLLWPAAFRKMMILRSGWALRVGTRRPR